MNGVCGSRLHQSGHQPPEDPRDRWFVGPVTLSRRTAVGVGAGVGLVGIVAIVLLVVVAGDRNDSRLHIEAVGEVEGPLLVYVEHGRDYSDRKGQLAGRKWHVGVHDLGTGKEWVAIELEGAGWYAVNETAKGGPYWVVVAGKSFLRVSATEMRRVSLDGSTESVIAEYSQVPRYPPQGIPRWDGGGLHRLHVRPRRS